ncbi:hypothetical protein KXW98_002505, partial [Aspergillus fumigatus]
MRKYEKVTLPVVVALAALSNGAPSMCFSGFYDISRTIARFGSEQFSSPLSKYTHRILPTPSSYKETMERAETRPDSTQCSLSCLSWSNVPLSAYKLIGLPPCGKGFPLKPSEMGILDLSSKERYGRLRM